jgi:dihydrofolate synthase / folylpolyglutamate synthase
MDYSQSVNYLYSLGHELLAAKFGLENITHLLDRLGRPDRFFKSVIIAGTNGKGSVASMIDAIGRASGLRTGLYTSPHLMRIEERIKVVGRAIPSTDFARIATDVRGISEALVTEGTLLSVPTFFEQLTAIALEHFRRASIDLAVLEVGMGGRLDATNAVDCVAAVISSIDFDHQDYLGNTIQEIAAEKAAIIKPGMKVVIGRQARSEASDVLMRKCLETNVLPAFSNEPARVTLSDHGRLAFDYESSSSNYSKIMLGLRGRHQAENAAAAIEAAEALNSVGLKMPREAVIRGLREVEWPGRLELIEESPPVLLDGAHNPAGARSLRTYLDEFWSRPITLIFAAMNDKDIEGMASALFPGVDHVVLTRVDDPRAANVTRMSRAVLGSSRSAIPTETVAHALVTARGLTPPDGLICVAGSLFLVGEVKRLIERNHHSPVS